MDKKAWEKIIYISSTDKKLTRRIQEINNALNKSLPDDVLQIDRQNITKTLLQQCIVYTPHSFYRFEKDVPFKILKTARGTKLIESDTATIELTFAARIKLLSKFLIRYSINSFFLCYELLFTPKKEKTQPINIIENLNLFNTIGKDYEKEFYDFLVSEQIKSFKDSINVYNTDKRTAHNFQNLVLNRRPFHFCIRYIESRMDFIYDYLKLSLKCFSIAFQSLKNFKVVILLEKDLALIPLIYSLDNQSVIDEIVISNSSIYLQPCFLNREKKNFISSMLWYSTNSKPLNYLSLDKSDYLFYQQLIHVDQHYTWNKSECNWINNLLKCEKVYDCGPIIMRKLPPEPKSSITNEHFIITLFDISPRLSTSSEKRFSEKSFDYYCFQTNKQFYIDIINVSKQLQQDYPSLKLQIQTKYKRSLNEKIDPEYVIFLKEIEKNIKLLDHTTSLFELVQSSNLVIVQPYSSPAYIAQFYNIPTFYYDPLSILRPDGHRDIKTINKYKDLERRISDLIKLKIKTHVHGS